LARPSKPRRWKLKSLNERVAELVIPFAGSQDTFRFMALTDLHWDSAHCDRILLKRHLDKALEEDAPVVIVGDMYDLMQGKWDPRSDQNTLRPEHRGNCYLDLVVNTSLEWFAPYAKILAVITPGNHEASITKRHQIDVLDRFCFGMRQMGSEVIYAKDWSYLLQRNKRASSNDSQSTKIFLHHGWGGGGPITRGLIDHSRTRDQWDGDIFISGHIHRRNIDENTIVRCSGNGLIQVRDQLFVRCGSYKHETNDSWHVSQGRGARPLGGWWITTRCEKGHMDTRFVSYAEVI